MDKKVFIKGIEVLLGANLKNPPEFGKKQIDIWWELMKDLQDERFTEAYLEIAKTATFFPSVGEIRSIADAPIPYISLTEGYKNNRAKK